MSNYDKFRQVVKRVVDEAEIGQVLDRSAEHGYDDDAIEALREVVGDTTLTISLLAAKRARHRARPVSAEDVAEAAEQYRDCCGDGQAAMEPLIFYWES
jgi:histone H3/H4